MTDEKLIEILQKIKDKCALLSDCECCPFDRRGCVITYVFDQLCASPEDWDIGHITEILKEFGNETTC